MDQSQKIIVAEAEAEAEIKQLLAGSHELPERDQVYHKKFRTLLDRYQRLCTKFKTLTDLRTYSRSLGQALLDRGSEGVAVYHEGRLAGASRIFFSFCSHRERWSCAERPRPGGGVTLPTALAELTREVQSTAEPGQVRHFRLSSTHGRHLEASLQRAPAVSGAVEVLVRDISGEQALLSERRDGERRDEFLAMLAHELRNPLAAMLSAAEAILSTTDPEQTRAAAEMIKRQAEHQSRLVNELLDTARVRQGKILLHKAPCDLREIIQEAVQTTNCLRSHGVDITVQLPEQPAPAEVDRTRMLQCVTNLLANAAKFTPAGGHNSISLTTRDLAWITVRDNGIGLAPEMLPRVFDLFSQAEGSLERAGGGLGLGLALTRRLAEMHGGGVRADSAGLGQGAEFTLWLPLAQAVAESARAPARPPPTLLEPLRHTAMRVLLVEDNADIRSCLALLLAAAGHEVLQAPDGSTGLDIALRERPDIVVSDLGLPRMDGITLARKLREALPQLPLIALSGYSNADEQRRALQAGYRSYLIKPVPLDTLLREIDARGTPSEGATPDPSALQ